MIQQRFFLLSLFICLALCPSLLAQQTADSLQARQRVLIETSRGKITVELFNETPIHRDNFIRLVKSKTYEGTLFHRVISQFMIQGGNLQTVNAKPDADLSQDTISKRLPAEIVYPQFYHKRGALCAAREGDDVNPDKQSSDTQFYIVTGKYFSEFDLRAIEIKNKITLSPEQREAYKLQGGAPHLDGNYSVFGQVVDGMDVVGKIERTATNDRNRPKKDIIIKKMELIPASQADSKHYAKLLGRKIIL